MSVIRPAQVAAANLEALNKALLAGELEVRLSRKPIVDLGTFEISAADTGLWTPNSVGAAQLLAEPMSVVATIDNELDAGANPCVFTLVGTSSLDAPLSGVATVNRRSFTDDQSWNFPRSWSEEFITTPVADSLIKTIDDVVVDCDADAAGTIVHLYAMPALADYQGIFCANLDDISGKAREFKAIQCGMNEAQQTKPGMLREPSLTVSAKTKHYADGLNRFSGGRSSVWLIPRKEGKYVSEYIFIKGFGGRADNRGGEGDTEVVASITGPYEEMLIVPALGPS